MKCERCGYDLDLVEVVFPATITEQRGVGREGGEGLVGSVVITAKLIDLEPQGLSDLPTYRCGNCQYGLPPTFDYDNWCLWAVQQFTKLGGGK